MIDVDKDIFVVWNPPNLSEIIGEDEAKLFQHNLPLHGMMTEIDPPIGQMSYMKPNGKPGHVTVRLEEVFPVKQEAADVSE